MKKLKRKKLIYIGRNRFFADIIEAFSLSKILTYMLPHVKENAAPCLAN